MESSEGLFEIREYIDDQGNEVGGGEVVDLTQQLDAVEKMAQQEAKSQDADESEDAKAKPLLNMQPLPVQSEDASFISELSLLADQSVAHPEPSDIMDVLDQIEKRATKVSGSRDRIEGGGWKKGFFG